MRYKHYEIESDTYNWILNTYGTIKDKLSDNFGKEVITQTTYPSTLTNCLIRLRDNLIKDKVKNLTEINNVVESIKELDEEFKIFIKDNLGNAVTVKSK